MQGSTEAGGPVTTRRPAAGTPDPTTPGGISGLLRHAGPVVVVAGGLAAGAVPAGTTVVPLEVDEASLPRRATPDPDRGLGPLDRLLVVRSGASHLLLIGPAAEWPDRYPDLREYLERTAWSEATNEAGSLWALPPEPPPGEPKVFCIGLMKTGTSSLHAALEQVGIRSLHWGGGEAYHAALRARREGRRIAELVGEEWGAYSDIETLSVRFDLADRQYPGSKFVLTVRDVDKWIESRRRHVERNRRNEVLDAYHGANVRMEEERWRADYLLHEERVRAYFAGRPHDLLVMDIVSGDGWEQLAPFLGIDAPDAPFPRETVYGRDVGLPPLCLARRADGGAALVEGERARPVDGAVAEHLRAVLGTPLPPNGADLPAMERAGGAVVPAAGPGLHGLLERAGGDALVAATEGRAQPAAGTALPLPWSVRRQGDPEPDGGRGALEALAVARGGRRHLVIPVEAAWWLARYPELAEHLGRCGEVVAANGAGVLWELPAAAAPGPAKVFGIGLAGTGGDRLRRLCNQLGLTAGRPDERTPAAIRRTLVEGRRLLQGVGERPDAWADVEALALRFAVADVQYPGSRFVLTTGEPSEATSPERRAELDAHRALVQEWFAGRERTLLELDPSEDGALDRLAGFLGRPRPAVSAHRIVDPVADTVSRTVTGRLWPKVRAHAVRAARRLHVEGPLRQGRARLRRR